MAKALQVHCGKHNTIKNNIIVGCKRATFFCDWPSLRPSNAHIKEMHRANRFVRNIVCCERPDAIVHTLQNWSDLVLERCDENLFHYPRAECYVIEWVDDPKNAKGVALEAWQAMGYDEHSILADPRLVDTENEDFQPRARFTRSCDGVPAYRPFGGRYTRGVKPDYVAFRMPLHRGLLCNADRGAHLFKWGSVEGKPWIVGFVGGNLVGLSSIWFLMQLYKTMNANIALGISMGAPFCLQNWP